MTEAQEFRGASLTISIEGELLEKNEFYDLNMYASIDKILPSLVFKIKDNEGEWIRRLKVYIGAQVEVAVSSTVKNTMGDAPVDRFCTFVITKIYDGFEFHDDKLAGFVQIWCEHSWSLYGNYTSHAFPPQKISQTIIDLIDEANTYAYLKKDEDYLKESSDEGSTPRYKVGESDISFIKTKLLPFLNVDMSNGFFFVDLKSYPRINSFNSMFSAEPVVVIVPEQENMDTIAKEVDNYCDNKGFSYYIPYISINITIGDDNIQKQFSQIKEKVMIDNNVAKKTVIGIKPASVSCGSTTGPSVKDKIPFNALRIEAVEATSSSSLFFMPFDDAVMAATNRAIYLNDMFTLGLNLTGYAAVQPGDTIQLFVPKHNPSTTVKDVSPDKVKIDNDSKLQPWMSGKWLVKSITVNVLENPDTVSTYLTVIRPTLIFNKLNTTIQAPGKFHSVS